MNEAQARSQRREGLIISRVAALNKADAIKKDLQARCPAIQWDVTIFYDWEAQQCDYIVHGAFALPGTRLHWQRVESEEVLNAFVSMDVWLEVVIQNSVHQLAKAIMDWRPEEKTTCA